MIDLYRVRKYCKENISLIENYDDAINSTELYDCHHKLEIELNVSKQYLINNNLYFNRPANELQFLTHAEHAKLHSKSEYYKHARSHINFKEIFNTTEYKDKMSIKMKEVCSRAEVKERKREFMLGKKQTKDHKWMSNGIDHIFPHISECEKYLELGYHFGRK